MLIHYQEYYEEVEEVEEEEEKLEEGGEENYAKDVEEVETMDEQEKAQEEQSPNPEEDSPLVLTAENFDLLVIYMISFSLLIKIYLWCLIDWLYINI